MFFRHHDLDDLRAAASIDLGFLADEVTALASLEGDPDYAAGLAAYEAARDELDAAQSPESFVAISSRIADGRFHMASAQARAEMGEPPQSATPCLFDPSHGPHDHFVAWTPTRKDPRPVPACAGCAAAVESGDEPEPRVVAHGRDAGPYWSAPAHFAYWFQGYFGRTSECYPVRLLDGFPLADQFAEPRADDEVITSEEVFAPRRRD
jgi:hypothetical protein